jgi:hypothetical protein
LPLPLLLPPLLLLLPWFRRQVSGWEDRGLGGSSSEAEQAATQLSEDLEAYSDPTELEALGEFLSTGCLYLFP